MSPATTSHRIAGAQNLGATERESDVARAQRWRGRAGKTRVQERLWRRNWAGLENARDYRSARADGSRRCRRHSDSASRGCKKGYRRAQGIPDQPVAFAYRAVPQRPAPTGHAGWAIRRATVLATQATFGLTPSAQPASPRRGTILLRTVWLVLCPRLWRVAHAALTPPHRSPSPSFGLLFHPHASRSIHACD